VLTIRGRVEISEFGGIPPEYASAAQRYLGEEAALEYLSEIDQPGTRMARISAISLPGPCSRPRSGTSWYPITSRRTRCSSPWTKRTRVVGYTAAHPEDGEMFLLFIHPAHAGRGIGRALLNAAHDALRAAGCTEAYLFVHEQNERALAVYAAAGYRSDGSGRVSDFRGTRTRELRLVKQLEA
jgi:ribosomal protein S18 acetylase RimI-like enzyme